MTSPASDLAADWIFVALLCAVMSVLGAVVQSFSLHSALARAKVHAPELAGIRLLALWAPATALWLGAAIGIGLVQAPTPRCSSAELSMLWLAVLSPSTAWPALLLARKAGVRLGCGYALAQLFPPLTFYAFGGHTCL